MNETSKHRLLWTNGKLLGYSVAKVVGSVAASTAVSAGVGYLNNGKQGAIDGACNGFMFGSLSACGGTALKYVSSAANKASVATSLSEPKKVANTIT